MMTDRSVNIHAILNSTVQVMGQKKLQSVLG